jgi:hypothetical protein
VEAVPNADRRADGRDRIAAEVARVEDHDVGLNAAGVVDKGYDPTVVLGDGALARDEDRLGRDTARTVVVDSGRLPLQVGFQGLLIAPRGQMRGNRTSSFPWVWIDESVPLHYLEER